MYYSKRNKRPVPLAWFSPATQVQAQGSKFSLFLVLALMLVFALQQVKAKYRSGIKQAQGYLPHVVTFGQ